MRRQSAAARPARDHVTSRDRSAVREARIRPQRDDPVRAGRIELPGDGQSWPNGEVAANLNEGLVGLAEEQTLTVVLGYRCMLRIDLVCQSDQRNRFTGSVEARAARGVDIVKGSGVQPRRRKRRLSGRLQCAEAADETKYDEAARR